MPTTRLTIPYASLGSSADIEEAVNDAFDRIDLVAATDDQGPIASLPTPTAARKGAYYWATDAKLLLRCSGSAWRAIVEFPIGGVLDWPAATSPPSPEGSGVQWIEENGAVIQKDAYPELFAAWGITAPTLTLQDRRGRAPVGAGTGGAGLTPRAVGDTFGTETHTLTPAQIPAHTHPGNPGLPNGNILGVYNSGAAPVYAVPSGSQPAFSLGLLEVSSATGNNLGGGGSHPNTQPSIVTRYFVRAR